MPDDIKISALTIVPTLDDSAVFPIVQELNGTPTTLKASTSQIAGKVAENTTYVNLETTSKNLVGAINEVNGVWLSSTLAAGSTSLVFTDNVITANSVIEVYADNGNLYYTSIVVDGANHTCTIGFPSQSSAVDVDIWVR